MSKEILINFKQDEDDEFEKIFPLDVNIDSLLFFVKSKIGKNMCLKLNQQKLNENQKLEDYFKGEIKEKKILINICEDDDEKTKKNLISNKKGSKNETPVGSNKKKPPEEEKKSKDGCNEEKNSSKKKNKDEEINLSIYCFGQRITKISCLKSKSPVDLLKIIKNDLINKGYKFYEILVKFQKKILEEDEEEILENYGLKDKSKLNVFFKIKNIILQFKNEKEKIKKKYTNFSIENLLKNAKKLFEIEKIERIQFFIDNKEIKVDEEHTLENYLEVRIIY